MDLGCNSQVVKVSDCCYDSNIGTKNPQGVTIANEAGGGEVMRGVTNYCGWSKTIDKRCKWKKISYGQWTFRDHWEWLKHLLFLYLNLNHVGHHGIRFFSQSVL